MANDESLRNCYPIRGIKRTGSI